jgi:hypothetical protein
VGALNFSHKYNYRGGNLMKKITQIAKKIIMGVAVVAILGGSISLMSIDPPGNATGIIMPRMATTIDPPGN